MTEAVRGQEPEQEIFVLKPSARDDLGLMVLGVVLTPVLVGLILLGRVWYKTASVRYRLTTQRLFVRTGLIAKHLEEVELFRVKDVSVTQGMIQRLMGVGTITVLSSDDSHPKLELRGIRNPEPVKDQIRDQFRNARKREGLRATEFVES